MTNFTGLTLVVCESLPAESWRWMIGCVGTRCTFWNAEETGADIVQRMPDKTIIRRPDKNQLVQEPKWGAQLWDEGTWRNGCLYAVETSHVAFTNSDCIVTEQAIQWTIDQFRKDPNQIINGQRREVGFELTNELVIDYFEEDGRGWDPDKIARIATYCLPRNWYMAMGDFQACPVDAFKEVGGYDETMTGYGGHDFDLHDRLVCWGLKPLISKEPIILHLYHGTGLQKSEHHAKHEERLKAFADTGDSNLLRVNPHRIEEWGVKDALPRNRARAETEGESRNAELGRVVH